MHSLPCILLGLFLSGQAWARIRTDIKGNIEVAEIDETATIDNVRQEIVFYDATSDFEGVFRCSTRSGGKVLTYSSDGKFAACCQQGQHLAGTPCTTFECCGQGHDLAGSSQTGYTCCLKGQMYDGSVCRPVNQPPPAGGSHGGCNGPPNSNNHPPPHIPGSPPSQGPGNHPPQTPGSHPPQAPGNHPPQGSGGYPPPNPGNYPPQAPGNHPPQNPGNYPPQTPGNHSPQNPGNPPSGEAQVPIIANTEKPCESGLVSGKCYIFTWENGHRFGFDNNGFYTAAMDSREHVFGKFQFCLDETCTTGKPINPGTAVRIKDIHGKANSGELAKQWLNNQQNGGHIGKTPEFAKAGVFSVTKWPGGKYCLGGIDAGIGPTCPSEKPSITFNTHDKDVCVPMKVTEIPCDLGAKENNCIW